MYNLIDYINDDIYTAYSREVLEEIALSLYEEEIFIWYNVLCDDNNIYTLKSDNLYEEAVEHAKRQIEDYPYDIREAILICDT